MGGPDGSATTRRRAPTIRPQQIHDAAFHEFGERGLAATRLDDVARRAQVAKGTIYLYFPNKEALFREMVRTTIVDAIATAEAAEAGYDGERTEDLLRLLVTRWWQFLRTERVTTLTRLVHAELQHFPDLMAFYAEEVIARARRLIAAVVARGIAGGEFRPLDPQVAARMLSAIWISHAVWASHRELHPSLGTDEAMLDDMLAFYLHALRPPVHPRPTP